MGITVETVALGPINANSHILTDTDTNECAVIDAGGFNGELEEKLKGKFVKYILLTHGHFDHILGVNELKKHTGNKASVCIHKSDEICLHDTTRSLADWGGCEQEPIVADRILEEADTITLGNTEIRVMHTPGHTPGGVCYIIESEKTMFTGDTLFSITAGRTDLIGGDGMQLYASLKKIASLDGDYRIYTGHNRSTTLEYEKKYNRYLRGLL